MHLHLVRHARVATLCATILVSLAVLGVPNAAAATLGCADDSSGITDQTAAWQSQLLSATNEHRTGMGLVALKLDTTLTRASMWKARDMARRDYFSHDDPAQGSAPARDPWDRLEACGWTSGGARAENIAAGYSSAASVIQGWLDSPGHRENIENASMRYVGFGVASSTTSSYGRYQVQMFASVAGPSSTEPMQDATSGGGSSTDDPVRDPQQLDDPRAATNVTITTATVTRSRCRSRIAVAGWCYRLVVRGRVVADGHAAGRAVVVSRRLASGRLVRLGIRRSSATGAFMTTSALRPPAIRTATWLRAHATRIRASVAATDAAASGIRWAVAQVRLQR